MLADQNSFSKDAFVNDFESLYPDSIKDGSGDDASFAFLVDGATVAIGHMPVPIPLSDIKATAEYAYNWQTGLDDTKDHKSHLIVSLLNGKRDQLNRYKVFTNVICSLLRTTNAIGVYMGSQSLLIPKADYLDEAAQMSDDYLPVNLWVYFGLRVANGRNSGYTYGLKQFNKAEMEILNSSKGLHDIRGFLFNITHYILLYNVVFRNGETIGSSENERIAIEYSKGVFVEGETFKFLY